jgi:hypothetical protein
MGNPIQHAPPFTFKDWKDFMHALTEMLGGQLGPGLPGKSKSTTEDGSQDSRSADARSLFITGIALKQVAASLPEGHALVNAVDETIADWEDDYCGTPPHPLPALALAASLAAFASILQPGDLQAAIQEEAGKLARKAFGSATATEPVAVKAA